MSGEGIAFKASTAKLSCVRQVANLSVAKNTMKFDNKKFESASFLKSLDEYAPKMSALLENIRFLDAEDIKSHGKLFKHFIFSDLGMGYGDKLIASTLLSAGFQNVYFAQKTKLLLDDNVIKNGSKEKFALLTTMPVFGNKIGPKFKKSLLNIYNERPENTYGQKCRFIILGSAFKEGIDLYDVRHAHIIEPQTSKANQKQVIGRGTRTCGQKGLQFIPNRGWPLYVHIYDTELTDRLQDKYKQQSLHSLFMSAFDLRQFAFADDLDKYTIIASIDYRLNKTVHNFKIEDDPVSLKLFDKVSPFKSPSGGGPVNCRGKCGKSPTPSIPATVADMLVAWLSLGRIVSKSRKERVREYLCNAMRRDSLFCERVNEAYADKVRFVRKYKVVIGFTYPKLQEDYKRQIAKVVEPNVSLKGVMPFVVKQELISANYAEFAWPKAELENQCVQQSNTKGQTPKFRFTPTQDFIRHYFAPSTPEKGLLVYQSVGTGKTCIAIATASTSFEPEGYTILWVTRASLKSDVWKNMFDQVCNVVLKEEMEQGKALPSKLADRRRLLSRSWKIPPMSYKQFTNLIQQKNKKLYGDLIKINGTTDPLRKTLLIIDEAHKLYGGDDLLPQERPNMRKLTEMIRHSYKTSKEDSVKVILMTATPYTKEPIEMVKLINLLREEPLPDTYDAFAERFLNSDGTFTTKGKVDYMNEVAGYVSYLNRELDARQFAQPSIHRMLVPMSQRKLDVSSKADITRKYKELSEALEHEVEDSKDEKRELTEEGMAISQAIKELPKCTGIKDKSEKAACLEDVNERKRSFTEHKKAIADQKKTLDAKIKRVESERKGLAKRKKQEVTIFENDFSQENMLASRCKV